MWIKNSIQAIYGNFKWYKKISVYLKPDFDPNVVKNRVSEFEYVESVKIIPKAQSWSNLKQDLKLPDVENPLPDTLRVKVDKPENVEDETRRLFIDVFLSPLIIIAKYWSLLYWVF